MTATFDPLAPVSCRYGAPMGRGYGNPANLDGVTGRIHLRLVGIDGGGYDRGGAYWGQRLPGQSLYVAWGICDGEPVALYMDATGRDDAKRQVREYAPDARFYR